jgi:drug/metabolite transporter (DMT)-like permease
VTARGAALFWSLALVWGIPYLLIRVAVDELSPAVVVFARCLIGALVLLPFALRGGGIRRVLARWPVVLAYAAVEVAGPWYLLSDAEQHITSSLAGLLVATVPIIGVAIAFVIRLDDRLDLLRAVGLLVGFGGVVALVGLDVGTHVPLWPTLQVLLVAVGYAIGPMIVNRYLSDLPPATTNFVTLTVCAVGYAPFAAVTRPQDPPSAQAVWAVVALGVVCTALAFILLFALIGEVGPTRATVITYVNPAVAIIAGVLLLDEPLTAGILVGFPLVLAGAVLATRRRPGPLPRAAVPGASGDARVP